MQLQVYGYTVTSIQVIQFLKFVYISYDIVDPHGICVIFADIDGGACDCDHVPN